MDDDKLLDYFRTVHFMTDEQAQAQLLKLNKHPDIKAELIKSIDTMLPDPNNIEIQGHTAWELRSSFEGMTLLGAYDYLIYLREEPLKARYWLRKGMPLQHLAEVVTHE